MGDGVTEVRVCGLAIYPAEHAKRGVRCAGNAVYIFEYGSGE
jgi:hypothetical protein